MTEPNQSLALAASVGALRNPALIYLASLRSPSSRASQRGALRMILHEHVNLERLADEPEREAPPIETFAWHLLRAEHTAALEGALVARAYAPATHRRLLVALRRVMHASWKVGHITAEEKARAVDFGRVTGDGGPTGKALYADEINTLIAACDPTTNEGVRAHAALALLFGGGMRRSEVVGSLVERIDVREGTLAVKGKRGKWRSIPIEAWASPIEAWLARRGRDPGPIICAIGRWNRITPAKKITPARLYGMVDELGEKAGVVFAPHDARRTVITALWRAGVDPRHIQWLAGHESLATTARYDRRSDDESLAAIKIAGRVVLTPREKP